MYELIEHRRLDANAASITFSNIPQIYTDLLILVSSRVTSSYGDIGVNLEITFNDSGSGYSGKSLYGTGSSTASYSPAKVAGATTASQATANTFANGSIYIANYTSSTAKSFSVDSVVENNATASFQEIYAGLWNDSTPITKIELYKSSTNLSQYSSATLYGVNRTSGIGRAPLAMGGYMSYSNGYWVHTFPSSGSFIPFTNMDVEYLVVAGGGGGPKNNYVAGGGGGAGTSTGVVGLMASTSYSITVGAGGSGTSTNNTVGTSGATSSFNGNIANGGLGTDLNRNSSGNGFAAGTPTDYIGAGGGGAGGNGQTGTGGVGINWNSNYYGGGGAGGVSGNPSQSGGIGGGGSSGNSGTPNTGGGGGGGSNQTGANGGNGGSGIVIVRYRA